MVIEVECWARGENTCEITLGRHRSRAPSSANTRRRDRAGRGARRRALEAILLNVDLVVTVASHDGTPPNPTPRSSARGTSPRETATPAALHQPLRARAD